jgi:hypothetical protein
MSKVELIEQAIEKAERRESKLTPLALAVPALSSLMLRALMNNLGSISTRYAENGVHKAGLFCSTLFKNPNLISATAIDSWASDEFNEDKAEPQFDENVLFIKPPDTKLQKIKSDSFAVNPNDIEGPIDLYLYDSDHSEICQCNALLHFLPAMADEFIFCVDDWDFPEVEAGTWRGLIESSVDILFSWIAAGNDHDNMGAWNGFAVFLLKKKP